MGHNSLSPVFDREGVGGFGVPRAVITGTTESDFDFAGSGRWWTTALSSFESSLEFRRTGQNTSDPERDGAGRGGD